MVQPTPGHRQVTSLALVPYRVNFKCHHCRSMADLLRELRERQPGDL